MLTLFFTFLSSLNLAHAQLQTQLIPVPGEFEIRGQLDYLNTSANYPAGGGSSSGLFGGGKYTKVQGDAQLTFDFTDQLRAYAGFSGGQVNADVINNNFGVTSVTTNTHTNSGLNEFWLGGQWWRQLGDFDLVPQADFVYPFWRVDQNSNDPLLGDGALRLQAGAWIRYNLEEFIPYVYLGYAFRDEGRSALLPYVAGLRYAQPKKFWLEGELHGFESMSSDTNTSNRTIRELYLTRVDGGSFQYDSINPGLVELALTAGMQFNNLGLYAGFAKTVMGRSAADSWSAVGGVTFSGSVLAAPARKESHFIPKAEPYEEKLFHENAVPGPRTQTPAEDAPVILQRRAAPKPRPLVRRKRPEQKAEPTVELMMKQTEKELEKGK